MRQQPLCPPPVPQVLVLSDQMLQAFPEPDKYIKCLAKSGYAIVDYTREIQEGGIEMDFPYVVIFLGTMQLGDFNGIQNYKHGEELVRTIVEFNANVHVMISGLVPRPMDHEQSRKRCQDVDGSYRLIAQELRCKFGWNVGFKSVYLEFLTLEGRIKDVENNFIQ